MANKLGMTLVHVPCWWDGSLEKLIGSIHFQRPDLFDIISNTAISINPLSHFLSATDIPGVGELMLAGFPGNDVSINSISSINPWWIGEKYDGVRCCWNSLHRKLYTRKGIELILPNKVADKLPDLFFDAEVWFGRGSFSIALQFTNNMDYSVIQWPFLKFVAFDDPSHGVQNQTFEKRYETIINTIKTNVFVIIAPRIKGTNAKMVEKFLHKVKDNNGEGVILQKHGSLYEHGRNYSLVKYKGSQEDREGIVAELKNGDCTLQLADGTTIQVPAESVKVPLVIGDVVTFSYESFSRKGEFVNPTVLQIRTDVTWPELVQSTIVEEQRKHGREERRDKEKEREKDRIMRNNARRYWTEKTMKIFFEKIAKRNKLDPRVPATWYSISPYDIKQIEGGKTILRIFKGYAQAIHHLFPDVNLKHLKTLYSPNWNEVGNRKRYFEEYAKIQNFNPKIPENWYSQSRNSILSHKGGSTILNYYNGNIGKALESIFPDIGLDASMFSREFKTVVKHKMFFENFAKQNNFDSKEPSNWYAQQRERILSFKGAHVVLQKYGGSVAKALISVFPNIGLSLYNFPRHKKQH